MSDEGKPMVVLDSFAVLALFGGEVGAEKVQALLQRAQQDAVGAALSVINLGEVIYITERERGLAEAQRALAALGQLPIEILPADLEQVLAAAHIKARYPIAYADAFAVATAVEYRGTVLTGDPEFSAVEDLVPVDWLVSGSAGEASL